MIIDPYTWHRFSVEEKISVAADTVAIRLKRPTAYHFRAGQYAIVRVTISSGQQLIRQYSFASGPDDEMIELLIQREPGGAVSNWFYSDAAPGVEIELSQPFGSFTLENTDGRPVLLIAGRVGIAPFLSVLREKRRRKAALVYSVREDEQICYPELLAGFSVHTIVTARSPRLDSTQLMPLLSSNPFVYICGSKQFVDAISSYLLVCGVNATDIRRELFTLQ